MPKFTDGAPKDGLGLRSHTAQEIGQEYCRPSKRACPIFCVQGT